MWNRICTLEGVGPTAFHLAGREEEKEEEEENEKAGEGEEE